MHHDPQTDLVSAICAHGVSATIPASLFIAAVAQVMCR